ncbi:MAG: hypothetical protein A3F11_10845 [Gammaproteobacteria bacterium RIFCSPHIGHO2_12_FULL_37_14]|nr:MAG: hypothetical protein A3F11_10845 [Gammaproteobacteria bacterium RIFCSPHIGHO2_12_FULL_37_14]
MKQDINSNWIENIPRLQWACRRGMLELDVLLGNFLKEAYLQLSLPDKLLFIQLLQCSDQELFSWLIGHKTPKDNKLAKIVKKIYQHARSRM